MALVVAGRWRSATGPLRSRRTLVTKETLLSVFARHASGVGWINSEYRTNDSPRSAWVVVSRLAGDQFGVVCVRQCMALGVPRQAIARWLADGRLYRLHHGVYAVGHLALTLRSRELGAVFACGHRALRSHRSAGAAHDLLRPTPQVEVTAPRSRTGHTDVVVHRSRSLERGDRTEVHGIPTTSVARTLVDLADVLNERQLAAAVHEAEVLRVFDLTAIRDVQSRVAGRRGRHRLERVLAHYGPGPALTRSKGERRLLRVCEDHGLPAPQTSVSVGGYELDLLWPEAGLAVEFDGRAFHHTVKAYYEDRRRDRRLLVTEGIQVIRVTWPDLEPDPGALVADLRDLLTPESTAERTRRVHRWG